MKKIKITNILLAFLLCFPLHFLYDKFPNLITSIISPVNESIWEHMKLLYTSILIAAFIEIIINYKFKQDKNNLLLSNFISALIAIPIFLIIFLPIYYIIGENFIVTIIIMLVSIILAILIPNLIIPSKKLKLEKISIILIIIIYFIFAYLTFNPPHTNLFYDKTTNSYGIFK